MVAGAKLRFGRLPDEACLHHVEQRVVHAAVGGVSVGEIALLQGKPP